MRIALIHHRLMLRGGLESRLYAYMQYFRDAGHEVTVFVFKVGRNAPLPEGVDLRVIPLRKFPRQFRAWLFDRRLRKEIPAGNFDLVLSLGRTTCHDAMIVAGNHRAYMQARGWRFKGISARLQIMLDDRSYKAPGILLPASEMIREQMLAQHVVDPKKIYILYPPTDPQRFHRDLKESKAKFRKKHGFANGKKSFLFVSSNHKLKGLDILLKVFGACRNLPIELIVAGKGELHNTLPNVRTLGFVRETEELYAAADFLILPSRYDAFGQVVTEALLCGTPVIVSDMTGAKAIVTEREGIVVEGFDVAAWTGAVKDALQREFSIPEDLVTLRGLSFEAHMQRILTLCGKGKGA